MYRSITRGKMTSPYLLPCLRLPQSKTKHLPHLKVVSTQGCENERLTTIMKSYSLMPAYSYTCKMQSFNIKENQEQCWLSYFSDVQSQHYSWLYMRLQYLYRTTPNIKIPCLYSCISCYLV